MAKVLLIQPNENIQNPTKQTVYTPLSLVYLGTAIEDKHTVKIYDRNLYTSDEDFIKFLDNYQPEIVGFTSGASTMLFDLMKLGKIVKEHIPNSTVVVGGVLATSDPDCLLNEPYVDYIIRGEGEEAFLEFCNFFDTDKKKLGELMNVNKNSLRPFVDMDKLKLPNYRLLDLGKYEEFYINFSRGCVGSCTFCYNVPMWGKNNRPFVRTYSTERAIELFKDVIEKYKRKVFFIVDDNFLCFRGRSLEICDFLSRYKLHFYTSARADNLNDEAMAALKKAGCHTLLIGIESGSQRILDVLGKRISVQQNIDAIRLCKKYKIKCDASLMIGLPTETSEDLKETVDFIKRYKPDLANVHIYEPLPAPLFDQCISKGLVQKPKTLEEWARFGDIFAINNNVSEIPNEELQKALDELKKFQLYKRKLKRLVFWMKIGEFKHVYKALKRFVIYKKY
jgi:radical SAM superfamily enzyme YgiQ (UPF0313 family)